MTRFALLPKFLLAACQQGPGNEAADAKAANQAQAPVKQVETLPPDETTIVETENGTAALAPASTKTAESFHGRWGLVPAVCTSTRGDAKGLLAIGADTLTFYESRARLEKIASATPTRFQGQFAFSGEGQNWTKRETLELKNGALVRSEEGLPQPLRYERCR